MQLLRRTLVATIAASMPVIPERCRDASPSRCCFRRAAEVHAEIHRIAFHRQIHEEDVEDEAREEHAESEHRADGVRAQPQIALPRLIQQAAEAAIRMPAARAQDDALSADSAAACSWRARAAPAPRASATAIIR